MSRVRRAAARVVWGAAIVAGMARALGAQGITLTISPLLADSTSPAPEITYATTGLPPELQPVTIQLQVALDAELGRPFLVRTSSALAGKFFVDSLLPQKTRVFFRIRLIDKFGTERAVATESHVVRAWLGLITPSHATEVLFSRQPTFSWFSPPITSPPGLWQYEVTIRNVAQDSIVEQRTTFQTSFVPASLLDACTSYRFTITARTTNGGPNDQITLSPGTFVIQTPDCPKATIFYQNFPNPFGRGALSSQTCFWFDLARRSTVSLTIYDLRLREVKRLVPGQLAAVLDSGAYGRQPPLDASGCDPKLVWDGRDDRGRPVPPGVYVAIFDADGKHETKKVYFKGP